MSPRNIDEFLILDPQSKGPTYLCYGTCNVVEGEAALDLRSDLSTLRLYEEA